MSTRQNIVFIVVIAAIISIATVFSYGIYRCGFYEGLSQQPQNHIYSYDLICLTDIDGKGTLYINPKIITGIQEFPALHDKLLNLHLPRRTTITADCDHSWVVQESAEEIRKATEDAKMIGKYSSASYIKESVPQAVSLVDCNGVAHCVRADNIKDVVQCPDINGEPNLCLVFFVEQYPNRSFITVPQSADSIWEQVHYAIENPVETTTVRLTAE